MRLAVLISLLFLSILSLTYGQTPDVFRLEYMLMPRNDSGAKLARFKVVANIPLKVKDSSLFVVGCEYNRLAYDLQRNDITLGQEGLNYFHIVDLNLAYVHHYSKNWRFIGVLTPRLSSTLTNPIENGDFLVNVTVGAFRDRQDISKPTRLVMGLAYNSAIALHIPLPFLYFEKRFHPNWTYVVGVPKTGLKRHFKNGHIIQTEFILDGYFVNLQNDTALADASFASSISSSAAVITLGYSYNITKEMSFYAFAGHTVFQSGVLRDIDRNDIFTLNDDPSFYFRTGFRIGL